MFEYQRVARGDLLLGALGIDSAEVFVVVGVIAYFVSFVYFAVYKLRVLTGTPFSERISSISAVNFGSGPSSKVRATRP